MLQNLVNNINDEYKYDTEILQALILIRSENVGPKTFKHLIDLFKDPKTAIEAVPELAARAGKRKINLATIEQAEKEISKINKYGARLIYYKDSNYPDLLRNIHDFPPIISVKGNFNLLNEPCFSIVGSRNSSQNGFNIAKKFAENLANKNWNIVSGMARGIDYAAHLGSLEKGTIAVLGGGIDNIYPSEHETLYHKITEKGCIVAEMPIGTVPLPKHFPLRNRIISGLSYGTMVAEASLKSGSLITAKCAIEQDREVFAIPGFPLDPRCQGPNWLIKQGAHLVENIDDIIEIIEPLKQRNLNLNDNEKGFININFKKLPSDKETNIVRNKILSLLSYSPTHIDEIIKSVDAEISLIYLSLLELELAGLIKRSSNDTITLVAS
ncbi:MAG: DNA-processing protein DprA [Sphingobacteriia bacterium]|nr:DNA-processing protein DprA [Sphingobacteriia bacterium]